MSHSGMRNLSEDAGMNLKHGSNENSSISLQNPKINSAFQIPCHQMAMSNSINHTTDGSKFCIRLIHDSQSEMLDFLQRRLGRVNNMFAIRFNTALAKSAVTIDGSG